MNDDVDDSTPHFTAIGTGGFSGPGKPLRRRLSYVGEGVERREYEVDWSTRGSGFDTPEDAALSGYPADEARVLELFDDRDDRKTFVVEVNRQPGYSVYETVVRHNGRWFDT